jgi:SAM-dependent methyltransferase
MRYPHFIEQGPRHLPSGKRKDLYNAGYFGVPPSAFRRILDWLQDRFHLEFEKCTFIDLGSGKGRALLIASEYAFGAIVGVELSPKLHAIAAANIAGSRGTAQRSRNARTIEADATEFRFPCIPTASRGMLCVLQCVSLLFLANQGVSDE